MTSNLPALIDAAERGLADARTLRDLRKIKTTAEMLKQIAKGVAGAREAQNRCAEIVIHALAREGQELAKIEKAKGRAAKGPRAAPGSARDTPTLEDLGISQKESSQAQQLAAAPDAVAAYCAEAKANGEAISTKGALRAAKGARKPRQPRAKREKKPQQQARSSIISLVDQCLMAVRREITQRIREIDPSEWAALFAGLRDEIADLEQQRRKEDKGETDGYNAERESA